MKKYPFEQVVVDSTSKFHKIKKEDYLPIGQYKIVDQSKEFIAGYTNEKKLVNILSSPIIIFGDHTKIFKYIDFPLALGADGAKALTIKNNLADSKYLYYYFRTLKLADAGYSRHFKFLKEVSIPLPEKFNDQIRIARVLTHAEKLIDKRKESIKSLDELLKSTFLEMFGDPQINPKRFPLVNLKELYIDSKNGTKCGPFGSALKKEEFVDNGVPVWNMDNISISGQMVMPFRLWITPEKYRVLEAYSVHNGDVIISRAGTVGKMCVARIADEKSIISTNLIRVRFGKKLLPQYFVSLMNYCKGRVGRLKIGADGAFTHMNTGVLDALTFPYPPIELQEKFAYIVKKVESFKLKYTQSLNDLENLYGSLSQEAFKGELDLSKVPVEKENELTELFEDVDGTSFVVGELSVLKIYSETELLKIIQSLTEGTFSIDELMAELENASFEEMPKYEELKEQIYKMLEGTNPMLSQTFDKIKKEIVLRVNI